MMTVNMLVELIFWAIICFAGYSWEGLCEIEKKKGKTVEKNQWEVLVDLRYGDHEEGRKRGLKQSEKDKSSK